MSMTASSVAPLCSARVAAEWITAPSARGSCAPGVGWVGVWVGWGGPGWRVQRSGRPASRVPRPAALEAASASASASPRLPPKQTHRVGHAELDDVGAHRVQLLQRRRGRRQVGVAGAQEGDERDPGGGRAGCGGEGTEGRGGRPAAGDPARPAAAPCHAGGPAPAGGIGERCSGSGGGGCRRARSARASAARARPLRAACRPHARAGAPRSAAPMPSTPGAPAPASGRPGGPALTSPAP
jgi:hypothetical protein